MDALDRAAWLELGVAPDGAARERTLDAAGLEQLLAKTEAAITDLEAQTAGGDDPPPPRLPTEVAELGALRTRVQEALERVTAEGGPERTNLTDPDATLQKTRNGGFVVGYNAQAMVAGVSPPGPDGVTGPGGLLITAADVTTDRDDHGQWVPPGRSGPSPTRRPPGRLTTTAGRISRPPARRSPSATFLGQALTLAVRIGEAP